MSERGAYMTEYFYCDEDRETVWEYLDEIAQRRPNKPLAKFHISLTAVTDGRMIAGTIKTFPGYAGEEAICMEYDVLPDLKGKLKHPVKFVVITDSGEIIALEVSNEGVRQL
jgi:hypothetical protein